MELRRITVRDIAKRAGVHFTTVSRALAKHPSIPTRTCERIRKIADELKYVPDPMLSALTSYRTRLATPTFHGNIAWLTNGFSRGGWNSCGTFDLHFKGATGRAQELGYQLEEFWLREPGMTSRRIVEILTARNIRGVILSPQPRAKMRVRLDWDRFAAVTFGFTLAWPNLHVVTSNCFQSMQQVVRHLRALGYRRLGLALTAISNERVNHAWSGGFLSLQHEWPRNQKIPLHMPRTLTEKGFMKWVKDQRPDAIISQELGLLEVLQQNGYRVPEDMGFATQSLTSYVHTRRIAGVDENATEAGAVAVNLLVGMMHRGEWGIPQLTQNILIKGSWQEGDTVARQNLLASS